MSDDTKRDENRDQVKDVVDFLFADQARRDAKFAESAKRVLEAQDHERALLQDGGVLPLPGLHERSTK